MAQVRIKLPRPHHGQSRALAAASRFNVIAGGEKSGKTTLAIEALLVGRYGALKGYPVAMFCADKDELVKTKRRVLQIIEPLVSAPTRRNQIAIGGDARIDFFSLDEKLDSWGQYATIVVDDAASIDDIDRLWDDALHPMLARYQGDAWFLSKPASKKNSFWSLYANAETDASWSATSIPSWENPHIDAAMIEKARAEMPAAAFDQEWGAVFLGHDMALRASQMVVGENETFRQWCERLANDGLKVDGKPFKLDDRPAMAWIYDQVPSTLDEAYRLVLVLMKCAQVGFTVMEMLATIYLGLRFGPATVGMFLPDTNLADIKSSKRFMPVVRTIPSVHKLMTMEAADGSGRKQGEGNVRVRQIGDAMFVFSWTSGRATTESIPMDILSYDEVQEMTLEQMEKTQERLSASDVRFTLMGSTANWPDADIHHWYKRGSQYRFHSECPTCGSKKPLDDYFPNCVWRDPDTGLYRYVCPNGHVLEDVQRGEWIPDNPDADPPVDASVPKKDRPLRIRSIHFPQFLSPTISAEEIIFAYNTATDMKNFFNRKLGKPYLDPSQVPVNLEHLANCVSHGKAAGVVWKSRASGTYMGIDQMGNFNVHVIKERLPDGRQAVVHIEETYSADPFARSSELMEQYGVAVCVVEINPNYNDAKKFAARHPGRVFICDSFGSLKEDMIVWGDAPRLDPSDRRTAEDARDRYTLRMDQYKCMQVSMSRFTARSPLCLFPDPQGLVQEVVEKGQRHAVAVLPRMFHHFTKTALVAEKDAETNQYRRSVKKIGIDPHFSYANMLCDVAWSRAHGTSMFILPEGPKMSDQQEAVKQAMPGLPDQVITLVRELPAGEVCGRCVSFDPDTSRCTERDLLVRPSDPGCAFFVPDEPGQ